MRRAFATAIIIGVLFYADAGAVCHAGIVKPEPPQDAQKIADGGLAHSISSDPKLFPNLHPEDLSLIAPLPIYLTGKEKFAQGELLSSAKSAQWAYIVMHEGKAVGEVDLRTASEAGAPIKPPFVASVSNASTYANALLEALHQAEQLSQVKKTDYEARILGAPFISLHALWLHGKTDDILIPFFKTPRGITAGQPYTEADIIKLLNAAAQAGSQPR